MPQYKLISSSIQNNEKIGLYKYKDLNATIRFENININIPKFLNISNDVIMDNIGFFISKNNEFEPLYQIIYSNGESEWVKSSEIEKV